MKFETLGRHILVEYYNCDEEVLKNPKLIEEFMNNSALNAKATIVDSVFHHFNPWGVSQGQNPYLYPVEWLKMRRYPA